MTTRNRRNYYRILHVQPDAPHEIIRSSYRALMLSLEMHPDRGGDHWNAVLLNEAYAVLSDPSRRRDYDLRRNQGFGRGAEESDHDRTGSGGVDEQDCCVFCSTAHAPDRSELPGARCRVCRSPLCAPCPEGLEASGRRAVQRLPREGELRYLSDWPGRSRRGSLEDLSYHGLRFAAPEAIDCYRILRIESDLFVATARVVGCRKRTAPRQGHSIGVEFFTLEITRPTGTFLSVRG